MDFEKMCDNAAVCCQRKELLENESVRECIMLNVYEPLKSEIDKLIGEVTELRACLRTAAGELSTYGDHQWKHPEQVYEYLLQGGSPIVAPEKGDNA